MSERISIEVCDSLIMTILDTRVMEDAAIQEIGMQMAAAVEGYVPESPRAASVILDCSRCSYISSGLFEKFLLLLHTCEKRELRLALCGLHRETLVAMRIARIDKKFTIYKDRDRATAAASS